MLEWWGNLSPWLRYGVAMVMLAISTLLWFSGIIWPWGFAIGLVMLFLAGRSNAEKKGYRNY